MIVIPVILAGGAMHWKNSKSNEVFWRLLPKCLATWMVVCTAAVGVFYYGNNKSSILILIASFLFMIADALLEIRFMAGVGCFAVGHFFLIVWMIGQSQFHMGIFILFCVGVLASIFLFRKELKQELKIYLLIGYTLILSSMMALAVFLPITQGKLFLLAGIGGVGFWISDMFVGKSVFGKLTPVQDLGALYLYYFSILCFAVTIWTI